MWHLVLRCFSSVLVLLCGLGDAGLDDAGHAQAQAGWTFERGGVIRGPRGEKRIALEFTGDEFAEGAPSILDALQAHRAKASFFVTGRFLRNPSFADVIARIRREGHYLGPHGDQHLLYASWDQPPKLLVNREQFRSDLATNLKELERHGVVTSQVQFFLPPFEHYTEEVARWTAEQGRILINYTPGTRSHTDYMVDDDPRFVTADAILDSIQEAERTDRDGLNGFLLLMHLGAGPKRTRDHPYQRLGELLERLQDKGYEFVRVDSLLAAQRVQDRICMPSQE